MPSSKKFEPARDSITAHLQISGWCTVKEIVEGTNLNSRTVAKTLSILSKEGKVEFRLFPHSVRLREWRICG